MAELSPLGLMLASATSVANVVTDVARKKVMDRQELVAGTFWIRMIAGFVFATTVGVMAWRGSPPVIHAPSSLSAHHVKNARSFASRLLEPDPATAFLSSKLSNESWIALAQGLAPGADPEKLPETVAAALSEILKQGESIFEEERFAQVGLSAETRDLQAKQPRSETLVYFNRLFLEDAFPDEIGAADPDCALFGLASVRVRPLTAYLIYVLILVALISAAELLLMRALQVSPMSLCIPFMSVSPVFLVPFGYLVLGEMPTVAKLLGVALIVVGSLVMHRQLFAAGWFAPAAAIFQEKGSRYVLLVAVILAITSPIEKRLISMSDPFTASFCYGLGQCVFFAVLAWVRRADCAAVMRKTPWWTIVAGLLDGATILFLYFTYAFLPVVITISIKRAGIVLSIFAGWLFFRERNITDKLIAASVMLAGALSFLLPLSNQQATVLTILVLAGLAVALFVTHKPAKESVVVAYTSVKEGN